MNTEIVAAILTAAFASSQRQALSSGRVDDSIREKYVEYLAFVRQQAAASAKSGKKNK